MTEPVAEEFSLDQHADLIREDRRAQDMIKEWTTYRKKVQEQLKGLMGNHHTGTMDGAVVIRYEPQNRFNATEFAKAYPNLAKVYTRPTMREEFDVEAIRHEHPELYALFQVRSFVNLWTPGVGEEAS